MKKLISMAKQFRDEESGAAMVEYTVLLGIITAATIALIILVGTWVTGQWTYLEGQLPDTPTATPGPTPTPPPA
ncbi:Flp family type IVb pilin [Mesorhizobium sp.]|uniref:Flp family type IVb pilin n=1 Tax=Mesorhizobium sp. TaxID=1871066 RepID=UPI000FE67562|nr:Flp family type IVb pilin [Mesorhizobium sp.]RWN58771.1 MAG: Flp family type IVb pilin [Mesorhizobium sp.]